MSPACRWPTTPSPRCASRPWSPSTRGAWTGCWKCCAERASTLRRSGRQDLVTAFVQVAVRPPHRLQRGGFGLQPVLVEHALVVAKGLAVGRVAVHDPDAL